MEKINLRKPVVAGQFYPASPVELRNQIETFIEKKAKKVNVITCMLPHAGFVYSGRVAAQTLSHVNIKDRIILLGPNHTGYGPPFSIMTEGIWQTPLGEIKIDSSLAKGILQNSKYLKADTAAHSYEHSLEVELPFLQYFKTDFQIVPISFSSDNLQELKATGEEIAGVLKETGRLETVMLLASSDMTHYESQEEAQEKDKEAIQAILELNEEKLMQKIRRMNISMCGYAPVIVSLAAAKLLGAKTAKLISYQTSGDVTGDKASVVGYAGIIIY